MPTISFVLNKPKKIAGMARSHRNYSLGVYLKR